MGEFAVDVVDRQVIQALQIDGRASSSALARALEVSERTVARRISRLRATGVVRVVGSLGSTVTGRSRWVVRVRTRPGAAAPLARALATRADTTWVRVLAGGTEVVCTLDDAGGSAGARLFLETLPRAPHVLDLTAQLELGVYRRGTRWLPYLAHALTAEQYAALQHDAARWGTHDSSTEDSSDLNCGGSHFDGVDRALVEGLRLDGRVSLEALAAATRTPASTVRRRLRRLRSSGALRLDVEVDHRALGRSVLTHLWMAVEPAHLERAGAALGAHPEVAFAAATTGRTNLYACVVAADVPHLHAYLTDRLASVPFLRDAEAVPVLSHIKGAGAGWHDYRPPRAQRRQEAATSAANSR